MKNYQVNEDGMIVNETGVKTVTLKDHVKFGNKKLPVSTAVFNMGSATRCPSEQLGLCPIGLKNCYAYKAEVQYNKSCPQYRDRQETIWKDTSASEFVQAIVDIKKRKRTPFTTLRINESGDFWSQDCVDKTHIIAKELAKHDIKVYIYTARCDLDFTAISTKDMGLNSSNQPLQMKDGVSNCFNAVNDFTGENPKCVGDCKVCSICSLTSQKLIEVLYH